MTTTTKQRHPIQPIIIDVDGVKRFQENAIVRFLLDWATPRGVDMNLLARMEFTDNDRQQFAQLTGYSMSGYGDLSYVDDDAFAAAERRAEPPPVKRVRPAYLSELSMSALRPGDTVSGRTNQMIERYLSMVSEDGADVRATFTGEEWDALLAARPAIVRERTLAEIREGMAFALFERPVLQSVIRGFDGASFAVLVELLEREPVPPVGVASVSSAG